MTRRRGAKPPPFADAGKVSGRLLRNSLPVPRKAGKRSIGAQGEVGGVGVETGDEDREQRDAVVKFPPEEDREVENVVKMLDHKRKRMLQN